MTKQGTSKMADVQRLEMRGMISLRCDESLTVGVAGLNRPSMGRIDVQGDSALAWMSPDEVLLMVPLADVSAALVQIAAQFQGVHHLAVDVSDARAMFVLTGTDAREVMAKLAPVDFHPDSFGPGRFVRSRLGQVAAAFWMTEGHDIHVICFRSVADYVADLLTRSAKDGAVGHF